MKFWPEMQCLLERCFVCRQKLKDSICHSDSAVFIFLTLTVQPCSESLLIYWLLLKYLYWIGWQGLWFGSCAWSWPRPTKPHQQYLSKCFTHHQKHRPCAQISFPSGHRARLVHAFITSRLDYCNSVLYGLPACDLDKWKRIQNTAARLVTGAKRSDHSDLFSETFIGYP